MLSRLWIIVIFILIFAAMLFAYSKYFIEPTYTATTTMYVYVEDPQTGAITYYDPTAAQKLVDSALIILKSDTVLAKVAKQSELNYTPTQIKKMISVSRLQETEFFTVSVTTNNPQHAKIIADAIGSIAPDEILRFYKTGTVEVLDQSVLPVSPSGPNTSQNTLVGGLIGFAIAILLIFIIEMFSTTIKTEQDLIDTFNLPVLGSIPEFDASSNKTAKKRRGSNRYGYYYSK